MTAIKLRPYQKECLSLMKKTKKGERKLMVSATGSGKTVIFSAYSTSNKGRVLILCPSTELREQTIDKIKEIDSEIDVGSVQANLNESSAKIVVATRQSLSHKKSKRIEEMLEYGGFSTVIIDEVHQAVGQIEKILNKLDNKIKVFGFTATPYNLQLNKIFDGIAFNRDMLSMIEEGYLCEPKAIVVESQTSLLHVKRVNGDFEQGVLESAVNNPERNRLVAESYLEFAKDRMSTIVFCTGIDHANNVLEEFQDRNISSAKLDSKNTKEEREHILNEFKQGKTKVLVNVSILVTGFDCPQVDCIIFARPTQSKTLFVQALGRGLRLYENKTDCLVIDINDIVKTHDLLTISNVFDIPIKHGETLTVARKRHEKEVKDYQEQQEIERIKQIERERLKLEQIKIQAQEVKLFNKEMKEKLSNRKFDYWKVDNMTYALSYSLDCHYVLEDHMQSFNVFNAVTNRDDRRINLIKTFDTLKDAISYIESKSKMNTFTDRKAEWKTDRPTDNQLKFCGWARNKWMAHNYFSGGAIKSLLKKAER